MNERKRKREPEYIELESEDLGFILEPAQIEVGSGYTVSVDYDEKDEQIVNVKTYGKVDMAKIKREIKRVSLNKLRFESTLVLPAFYAFGGAAGTNANALLLRNSEYS